MKSKGFSRQSAALAAITILLIASIAANLYFLSKPGGGASTEKPAQTPVALTRFKASGLSDTLEQVFLPIDAGKDRGIWASNGLDPEFITISGRGIRSAELKEMVPSEFQIGYLGATETLVARSNGVPIKVVASITGVVAYKVYVNPEILIKTVRDLDGKKIGLAGLGGADHRIMAYISNKTGIRVNFIVVGEDIADKVAALKAGRIDAFPATNAAALRLVDSGELALLAHLDDLFPKPFVSQAVWATEDLIEQNPDLVRRFVKATLESVRYVKDNPKYASDLYIKRTNAPKDLADVVVVQPDWTPDGRGSDGRDLLAAIKNTWQFAKDSGAVPTVANLNVEEALDTRLLP